MSDPILSPPRNPLPSYLKTSIARHVLLVLGLLLVILIVTFGSKWYGDKKAVEWLNKYNATDVKPDSPITTSPEENANTNSNTNTNVNANKNAAPAAPTPAATGSPNGSQTPAEGSGGGNENAGVNANRGAGVGGNSNGGGTTPGGGGQTGSAAPASGATPVPTPNPDERHRLDEQLGSIRAKINHHGAVMAFFFEAYYMAISVVLFTGLIAAVALFFIAQNGWSNTDPYVKTIFLVMAAAAAYYGLFPPVFQQQQNISDNKTLFLEYKSLENEVVSYPLTGANIQGDPKTAKQFITYVDSTMKTLGNIAIGFDYTKISYKGAFDLNKDTGPSNANANGNAKPTPTKSPVQ
ncbi:MAG: hypothetical protein QOJ76_789 [Acidobacteriota bacterium]|nr:hypothetical protein [Acidobacteriota bacterium]